MKKSVTKIVKAAVGLTLAVGMGMGASFSSPAVNPVYADSSALLTFDFEDDGAHRPDSSNSYAGTNTYAENGVTISLTRTDSVITGTPISGSANILGRIAKDSSLDCCVEIGPMNLSNYVVTGISYKIKGVNSMTFLGQYSTNGSTWTNLEASANCPSSATPKSYTNLNIEKPSSLYFKLTVGPGNASTKRDFQMDDLVISGTTASAKTLSSITVSDNSGKTWHVGDTVETSDLRVVATYSDSSTNTITNGTGVTITSGATLSSVGSNTVNVSYSDGYGSADGSVAISALAAISLSSIAVTTAPTKTTYNVGELFDTTGMVVTATYSDSSTANVTASCSFAPSGALTLDDDEITISYTYNAVEKTTSQAIVVNPITNVTFVAGTDVGTSSSQSPDTITKNGISMHGSSMHDTDSAYRFYSGCVLTISSTIGNIKKIEFNMNGSYNSNLLSASAGSYDSSSSNKGVWTGIASSVEFTLSAQARCNSVAITLAPTTPTIDLDYDSIDLKTNESAGKQVSATVYNIATPTYSWTANNNNVTLVNANTATVTIKPNTNVVASAVVTLTVGGVTPSKTATVDVSITLPAEGETAETAYTVAHAKTAISESDVDIPDVYIGGTISQIDEISISNGNATYWISDDGTTSNQFKIYRGLYLNSANFTAQDQIMVGDEVIVFGTISKHYSNLNAGNHIVSMDALPRVTSISLTPSEITVEPEAMGDIVDLFTNITINQEVGSNKTVNDIVWSSENNSVFEIDDDTYLAGVTHRTSTIIHASLNGVVYGSATINVIDSKVPVVPYNNPVEWTVVTDISTLTVGDQVVLTGVKSEVAYAAGTYSSGNNVPADTAHTLTISGDKITDGVVDTMIYTLEEGTAQNSVAFKDSAGKYLFAAGATSNNYMNSKDSVDGNASFILNADGTVVAQGASTHNYMRYNNEGASNLFSCYGSSSSTGDLITFYKRSGGSGIIDLTSASTTATLHGTESAPGVVDSVYLQFGAKISIAQWEAVEAIGNVTDYGVMLFRTRNALSSDTPVKDAINLARTPTTISKGSGNVPSDPENGFYSFTVTVTITSTSNYDMVFCAAPFIEVDGVRYILGEVQHSVNSLAQYYIDHDISSDFSDDGLLSLVA